MSRYSGRYTIIVGYQDLCHAPPSGLHRQIVFRIALYGDTYEPIGYS